MSVLIDDVVRRADTNDLTKINGCWFIAKPLPYYSIRHTFKRINDAFRVMRNKSFAVHYKCDE